MASVLRPVEERDLAQIAYLVLKWDAELPEWCKQVHGNVKDAELAAQHAVYNPDVLAYALEEGGEVIGGFAVVKTIGIFSSRPYGQLVMWYVLPDYRGGLRGLRLLNRAVEVAQENGLHWLEAYPWADDINVGKVLERLGFNYAVNVYVRTL